MAPRPAASEARLAGKQPGPRRLHQPIDQGSRNQRDRAAEKEGPGEPDAIGHDAADRGAADVRRHDAADEHRDPAGAPRSRRAVEDVSLTGHEIEAVADPGDDPPEHDLVIRLREPGADQARGREKGADEEGVAPVQAIEERSQEGHAHRRRQHEKRQRQADQDRLGCCGGPDEALDEHRQEGSRQLLRDDEEKGEDAHDHQIGALLLLRCGRRIGCGALGRLAADQADGPIELRQEPSDLVAYRHRDHLDDAALADVGHELTDQTEREGEVGADHQQEKLEGDQEPHEQHDAGIERDLLQQLAKEAQRHAYDELADRDVTLHHAMDAGQVLAADVVLSGTVGLGQDPIHDGRGLAAEHAEQGALVRRAPRPAGQHLARLRRGQADGMKHVAVRVDESDEAEAVGLAHDRQPGTRRRRPAGPGGCRARAPARPG